MPAAPHYAQLMGQLSCRRSRARLEPASPRRGVSHPRVVRSRRGQSEIVRDWSDRRRWTYRESGGGRLLQGWRDVDLQSGRAWPFFHSRHCHHRGTRMTDSEIIKAVIAAYQRKYPKWKDIQVA